MLYTCTIHTLKRSCFDRCILHGQLKTTIHDGVLYALRVQRQGCLINNKQFWNYLVIRGAFPFATPVTSSHQPNLNLKFKRHCAFAHQKKMQANVGSTDVLDILEKMPEQDQLRILELLPKENAVAALQAHGTSWRLVNKDKVMINVRSRTARTISKMLAPLEKPLHMHMRLLGPDYTTRHHQLDVFVSHTESQETTQRAYRTYKRCLLKKT